MNVKSIKSLVTRILDQYNKKPEGWKVLNDRKGNVLVLGPKVGYRLKLVPLNPREYTGVGVKINRSEEMRSITQGVPSYGFRPLSDKETKELFSTVHQGSTLQTKLIQKLLGTKPVPTREIRKKETKAVLTGPVITHPSLSTISKGQRELEKKLSMEADKLFRKKYPHRAAIYS